ncbi:YihY/virulence factor BrkB family protein [bacterium]|nr:YihY/virulence factor BrkB family protein [bacterium]
MGLIKKVSRLSEQVSEMSEVGEEERQHAKPHLRWLFHAFRFIQITVRESIADKIPLRATALTFASLLTMVPLLVIAFQIFRMLGGQDWFFETVRPFILDMLAPGTGPKVAERLQEVIENAGSATLGGVGVGVLVLAVYSIFSGVESTINVIWGTKSRAGSLQRLPLYWGLVTIVPILVIGSLAITTYLQALPFVSETVSYVPVSQAVINRLLSMGMVIIGFFLLYRFVPATSVHTLYALIGSVVVGVIYEGVKAAFIVYTADLVQYDVIYGSLAIFPLLLVWVNLSWVLVLGGMELTYVAQHYRSLVNKPKHIRLSRSQRDSAAYLLLKEATQAFHTNSDSVHIEQWSKNWKVPPHLAEETVDLLREGGLVERAGKDFSLVLLARDPKQVTIAEIEALLSNESRSAWRWPESRQWGWLKNWMKEKEKSWLEAAGCTTLAELVESMEKARKTSSKKSTATSSKTSKTRT